MVSAKVLSAKAYNGYKTGSKKIVLSSYQAKRYLRKPVWGGGGIDSVVVDVPESPIQRPKKNSIYTILEKRNSIP
jgi:predicted ATP-grasp superfamily ATP-dependent carboligase